MEGRIHAPADRERSENRPLVEPEPNEDAWAAPERAAPASPYFSKKDR